MKKSISFSYFFYILLLLISNLAFAQKEKFHRISAEINREKLTELFNQGLEIDHFRYENDSFFSGEVSDSDLKIFRKNKIPFEFEIEDLEKNREKFNKKIDSLAQQKGGKAMVTTPSNFALGSYAGFYTFAELQTILDQMRSLYPNLISAKSSIGNSIEGRPILMVKISDNPDADETEPEMLFTAVHHAREPMSMSQMIFTMWHLLENYATDPEIQTLVNSSEIYILPCVNPDGYVHNQTTNPAGGGLWRKNRRNNGNGTFGVDMNRNYAFQWGRDNTGSSPTPSSDTYRGTSAFSEPETQVLRNFSLTHNFTVSLDYHAYGNYCIYSYGYVAANPNPELPLFQQLSGFLTAENSFLTGNATATVNYVTNGDSADWKYGEQTTKNKTYAFIPEVGSASDGFWPASSRIVPLSNSTVEMNKKALKLSTFFASATPTGSLSVTTNSGSLPYTFQNFSIKPTVYTVSVTSASPYITSIGAAKTYSNLAPLATLADNIAFTLDPATPIGTSLAFNLTVDNGLSPITRLVTITYNCGSPINLTSTGITSTTATVNWAAVTGATNYRVEYKTTSASTWIIANNTATSTSQAITGLTAATSYNFRITANCAIGSSTPAVGAFTTLSAITYCASRGTNLNFMWVDKVNLGSINRISGADGGYFNGTALTTTVVRGTSQTIRVSAGFTRTLYNMGFRVWIDYNRNGVFTDAGEQVASGTGSTSGDRTFTFTIPNTAVLGATRMRVSGKYNAVPTSCETFTYGEVEDYTINISATATSRISGEPIVNVESNFWAAPNPIDDYVKLNFDAQNTPKRKINVLAMNGKIVLTKDIAAQSTELLLNTKDLNSGIYLLQLYDDKKSKIIKVLKK